MFSLLVIVDIFSRKTNVFQHRNPKEEMKDWFISLPSQKKEPCMAAVQSQLCLKHIPKMQCAALKNKSEIHLCTGILFLPNSGATNNALLLLDIPVFNSFYFFIHFPGTVDEVKLY